VANEQARAMIDAVQRTLPSILSGAMPGAAANQYVTRQEFAEFDAPRAFDLQVPPTREEGACRCGEVLRGLIRPQLCPLFARGCSPQNPVGPCMVSSEGSCAAAYKYDS